VRHNELSGTGGLRLFEKALCSWVTTRNQAITRRAGLTLILLALAACVACDRSSSTSNVTPVLTSISVTPTGASTTVGGTQQFTATANYSSGPSQNVTSSATWSSSNTAVASIQSTGQSTPGLASGVVLGSVTITASLSGVSGSTSLSVAIAPVVTSLSIAPTSASMTVGNTLQFIATAGYNDGSIKIVTSSASWSSSDATIASIQTAGASTPGLAAGVAPGNVNVTASYGGVDSVTTLNVTGTNLTLSSFYIGQIDASIAPGAALQLFSYAEYTDGSVNWVTSTTHWTSSNPSVAAIQDQTQAVPGLVTASAAGTTTITAVFGGITQTTTLTVVANAVPLDLMDMTASQNYLGFPGGLYENGNTVPTGHDSAGKAAGAAVEPLNQNGKPTADGAIVFLGIGMSNATEEFSAFIGTAASTAGVNHATLAMEDGATGAATACYWTVATGETGAACPDAQGVLLQNQYDRVQTEVLATATGAPSAPAGCGAAPATPCLTEAQVQVLWIKNANPRPGVSNERTLCDATVSGCVNDIDTEAINYESQLGQIVRAAKSRYPNLQQVFISSRIYAGYATLGLSPEPYAYEYGYSVKWLIEAQVVQEENGTVNQWAGDMSYTDRTAAWTAWGWYIWADGTTARSDGLVWLSSDFQSDGTHPDAQGTTKVVNQLMGFFTTSPYTPWFLQP
jgi:uncharacterized protein YjdB